MIEDIASVETQRQRKEDLREWQQVVRFLHNVFKRNLNINSEDIDRGQLIKNLSLTPLIQALSIVDEKLVTHSLTFFSPTGRIPCS